MTSQRTCHLIAVDIGNSGAKFGWFQRPTEDLSSATQADVHLEGGYPTLVDGPVARALGTVNSSLANLETVLKWLPKAAQRWYAVSVNRPWEAEFSAWLRQQRPQDDYVLLQSRRFPLGIDVQAPQRVGTDRLAAAVATNRLRTPSKPAIIVDAGTAITVDVVTSDGVFRGGAILPGIQTALTALAEATDALPRLEHPDLSIAPAAIGKSTSEAIRSGIVWGCVGAVRELVSRMSATLPNAPEVFCTGGDGWHLTRLLDRDAKFDPNLVLRGIALTGFHHLAGDDQNSGGAPAEQSDV